jgi:cysteine synthase A
VNISGTVLDAIGNTPIGELRKVAPPGCARIVAKLEWGNPTGSMKDRMARAVIEAADHLGRAARREDGNHKEKVLPIS